MPGNNSVRITIPSLQMSCENSDVVQQGKSRCGGASHSHSCPCEITRWQMQNASRRWHVCGWPSQTAILLLHSPILEGAQVATLLISLHFLFFLVLPSRSLPAFASPLGFVQKCVVTKVSAFACWQILAAGFARVCRS